MSKRDLFENIRRIIYNEDMQPEEIVADRVLIVLDEFLKPFEAEYENATLESIYEAIEDYDLGEAIEDEDGDMDEEDVDDILDYGFFEDMGDEDD